MMKTSRFGRWGPAAGVVALGLMAFSLSLEGAAPSPQPAPTMKDRSVPTTSPSLIEGSDTRQTDAAKPASNARSGHATGAVSAVQPLAEGVKFGRMPTAELPVNAPMTVDYRDDAGTRLRQAGELVGPYRPNQRGNVAQGGCSFDIDCDDCNPCTNDVCDIEPGDTLGSGTCINDTLPNGAEGGCSDGLCCNGRETCQSGVCENPGAGTGIFDINACQFPCSGGTLCNEDSNLCRLPCDGTNVCAITGDPCTSTPDCPPQAGNYCKNCQDGVNCNGVETCVAGVCEAGTNPCGAGANCGEKDCSGAGTTVCTSDADCAALSLGNCNRPGPICFPGRCCANATAEPVCTKRQKSGGTCSGGSNPGGNCQSNAQCRICTAGPTIGKPCTANADCGGGGTCGGAGTCNVSASCDGVGGVWYATDDGDLPITGGTICPTDAQTNPPNERTLCPKYSSGIAPIVNFDTETAFVVGLFSQGPCDHQEIGDDYHIENGSPIAMEKFRWVGGGGGRLLIEFYDASGNFIEDVITGGIGGGNAVNSLNFLPPLTIPADGYWVVSVATNFAPNGQTFVTATDAVDEGTNLASGANSLWFDGGPVAGGFTLRECVGGTNDGAWCDPDDLGDSECVGGGGACQNRNNVLAFEIEGLKVAAPTGACCNDANGTCTPGVIPWVCTGQGNNYQGNDSTCPGNCGVGACCTPAGTCSVIAGASCTGPNTFQGFGTDCSPNCCEQPYSGGDNCEDVTPHNIPVPDPGDPANVVTISGDNSGATGPDSCLQGQWNAFGGTYLTVDNGWWEAFTIDDCAFVRVDFCCSDPIVEPAWAVMWKGCPCDDQLFTAVDPNVPSEPANKRGSPYCEDDNLWNKFGPLPAGTYYIPVYSVPPGANSTYQMHITVDACPIAACCDGTSCIETDQLGCAELDGANFLAPPFRTTATTVCTASTCNTGSCCYIPGQGLCQDVIAGSLASETSCNSANGEYKGGARCNGCVCAAGSPPASCNEDSDCGANGPCNNPGGGACSGQNLTQPTPCPACEFESTLNCQRLPGNPPNARLSDDCVGNCISDPPLSDFSLPSIRVADDFVASVGGNINSVCVWGMFLQQGAGLADCSASGPPEQFTVRVYNDSNGLPSSLVGTRTTTVIRKADTGGRLSGRIVFQWQLALSSGIPVTSGNTYWLEVVNNTDESTGHPDCDWFWANSDPNLGADSGNQYTLQDAGDTYTFGDATFDGADQAWCLDLNNTVPPIKEAACCTCGGGVGSCSVLTLENCTNADGSWQANEPDCIGVVCRNNADAADTCATDKVAVSTGSATAWNNFCTNTDGPVSGGNGDCSAGLDYQNDIWFTWTADCDGEVVIETCDLGGEIDTGMMIYTNNNGTCPCPTSAANELDCSDDGCVFTGAGSRIAFTATNGVCYTIRVAGFLGVKGQGALHVSDCAGGGNPVDLIGDPSSNPVKTRFISFSATGGTGESAIRIILSSMHVVVPPYSGGLTVPYTAFNGQVVWAGPPTTFVESSSNPIPTKVSFASCTPHYRDWNTEGLIHVTGPQIVPSSTFHLENVAAACQGNEGSAACLSGGGNVSLGQLEVKTTRWGDVTDPYNPPSATVQPDVADIGALVNKFRSAPGAPIKARAEIAGAPGNAWGEITAAVLSVDLGFSHISACVDAFRGTPYPYKMGKCAGNTNACTTNSDCGGAGPCNLYCPN